MVGATVIQTFPSGLQQNKNTEQAVIEIRSYNLKQGTRPQFHRLVSEEVMPLLTHYHIKVVDYGPSQHDSDSYFLLRTYPSAEAMQRSEEEFYNSADWVNGPREKILSLIVNYTTVVLYRNELNQRLKEDNSFAFHTPNREKEVLRELNRQFIENFLKQDVAKHNEIIHPDFVCIESNGSIVSRDAYLKAWATDFNNSGYTSFRYEDEVMRIFGNTALVRAKTVYTKNVEGKTVTGYTIYTDTYVKEEGTWKCVQVQITPVK